MICIVNDDTGEIVETYESGEARVVVPRRACVDQTPKETETEGVGMMAMDSGSFVKCNSLELEKVMRELKPSEMKLLICMVNRVEYKSNCVVFGRNRTPTEEFIAEWCNVSVRSVSDALKGLVKKMLIAKVLVGEGKKQNQYYVNPWLVTKGRKVNATLKSMFREYEIRTKGMVKWKDLDRDKEAERWKYYRR